MAGDDVNADSSSLAMLWSSDAAESLIKLMVENVLKTTTPDNENTQSPASDAKEISTTDAVVIGQAALDAFLQVNVTGPVLPAKDAQKIQQRFQKLWKEASSLSQAASKQGLARTCLKYLETDGVAPYAYMPYPELFALAKYIFLEYLKEEGKDVQDIAEEPYKGRVSLAWMRLRVNVCHYKLLTQPSLGPGSNFTRSSQWSEVPSLNARIESDTKAARKVIIGDEVWAEDDTWSTNEKTQFLLEVANQYILLGKSDVAKEVLAETTKTNGFHYALSGALGKRTKFQQSSTSQLVVLAKSREDGAEAIVSAGDENEEIKPDALKLNDDTLLEDIEFTDEKNGTEAKKDALPSALANLTPDDQPQLSPLDQIILLTEATLRDAFSPADTLTAEEVLPYAVRVIADKSTNWQIYTQALLVRSRIELHRSRTLERGVLQLQAVADQVLTDMTEPPAGEEQSQDAEPESEVPAIQVTDPSEETSTLTQTPKPTTFLPAPKPTESAPAPLRLRYIHALSSPPRWHLESELAYAWAGVGSLSSALEIFKRLRLWAEVALCLASAEAVEDEQGKGSGGDDKARGIIRWRLFNRTGAADGVQKDADEESVDDVTALRASDFSGPERVPPPPNAARLWCILGDLEEKSEHYERAWAISNNRYSRAQKSLGEHYLKQKDLLSARKAYKLATGANRLDPDMWSRLGDISLRLADFEEAAESYSRAIGSSTDTIGGEGARTWSNLGSALWSLYREVSASGAHNDQTSESKPAAADDEEELDDVTGEEKISRDPAKLLTRALAAYKKGASIAHDNWRIWDNVLTLCTRMEPTPVADIVLAIKHIIRIRKTEDALDADLLTALLRDQVLSKDQRPDSTIEGVYEPPRGTTERLVTRLIEEEIVPLITHRSDLWTLVSRLRAWRGDHAGAIDAAESAWRCAIGSSPSSSDLLPNSSSAGGATPADWTVDRPAWEDVVAKTDDLAGMLENWGPGVPTIGTKWRGRVRSAVRTVMGKGRENWEGSTEWKVLEGIMEGLKGDRS